MARQSAPGKFDAPAAEQRTGIIVAYPCDIFDRESLAPRIAMAPVYQMNRVWPGFDGAWEDVPYSLFPLPDLVQDGEHQAAVLDAIQLVSRKVLDRRSAILTTAGSVALAERVSHWFTRTTPNADEIAVNWDRHEKEYALWEEWCRGLPSGEPGAFQVWMNAGPRGSRRSDRFPADIVAIEAEMRQEIARRQAAG